MKYITIKENGINLIFKIENNKIFLVHFGLDEFNEEIINNDNTLYQNYRLFELQLSGKDQPIHRGAKNMCTSEGNEALFDSINDYKNEYGRKVEIVLKTNDCIIQVNYQFYNNIKSVRTWTNVKNIKNEDIIIEHISSFVLYGISKECLNNNYDDVILWSTNNSWYCEGQWIKKPLKDYGIYRVNNMHSMARALISNTGSWSSKEHLPIGCIEQVHSNQFMMFEIESGGSWNFELSACFNQIYINLFGPSSEENQWYKKLKPNESFNSVYSCISFSNESIYKATNEMINYRRIIRKKYSEYNKLSVIYNPYMNDAWDYPNEELVKDAIKVASNIGCDIFCIDAGWFGKESDIMRYIGNWEESKCRFPSGLNTTLNLIKESNMIPGLWLEVETVGIDSPLRNKFPHDCFFNRNGKVPINNNRIQLDYTNLIIKEYYSNVLNRIMNDYQIGYIKMDYNHDSGAGTEINAISFGEGLMNHIDAYSKWINNIMDKYKNLIIEYCASGGLRMDYYHLKDYSICSISDQTNYKEVPYIAANIAFAGTPEQMGVWCYPLKGCDKEEVIFNVVNCLLLRMQLSGGVRFQEKANKELLIEGIKYHKKINKNKCNALSIWPLGFVKYNDDKASYGLKINNKIYLAIWNMKTIKEITIPLNEYKVKNIKIGYPSNDNLKWNFIDNNLKVYFENEYQARLFEIELTK